MRGINRQNIFENKEDYCYFMNCIKRVKEEYELKVLGYCLMSNHTHIVVGVGAEPIGVSFKRIGVRYASWYNRKNNRQGPLFQDRFWSEPIEDDNYLLSVIRYIHQNPIKAGICNDLAEYEWDSYADYLEEWGGLTDTDLVLGILSPDPVEQKRIFAEFSSKESDEAFIDISESLCISDEALRDSMVKICGTGNIEKFQALSRDEKNHAIREMRKSGMAIRKIAQNTGVSFSIVRRICF